MNSGCVFIDFLQSSDFWEVGEKIPKAKEKFALFASMCKIRPRSPSFHTRRLMLKTGIVMGFVVLHEMF